MNFSKQRKLSKKLEKRSDELYSIYNSGASLKTIGKKFGVARSTIGRIFKKKKLKIKNSSEAHKVFLDKKKQENIRNLLKKKITLKNISKRLKVGKGVLNTFLIENKLQPGIQYKELPENKICDDYKKGMTVVDLAKKYKSNSKTIRARLHKNNIKMLPSKKRLTVIVDNLKAHYNDIIYTPKTLGKKSKELKVSKYILTQRFKDKGYKLRTKSEEQIILNNEKNPNLKFNFFNKKTSLRDYWIGFIAADGNVTGKKGKKLRLSFGVSAKDKSHVYKFKKVIGGGSVTTFNYSRYDEQYYSKKIKKYIKGGIQYKFQLDNTTLVKPLLTLGIVPRKTYTLKPSKELIYSSDFWRGFIDGDGNLTNIKKTKRHATNLSLASQSIFIYKYFLKFLKKNKINNPLIQVRDKRKKFKFYIITLSGLRARIIAKKLYFKANKFSRLERKYDLAMEWLKYKSKRFRQPL